MSSLAIALTIISYLGFSFIISYISGKKVDNQSYFTANRQSKWWMVALAMIGACFSGISFVSVPGMVGAAHFSYIQMSLGFVLAYFIISFVLIPIFYKQKVISIYQYLENRFSLEAQKTGAAIFLISKLLSCAARLYLLSISLQVLLFDTLGISFYLNVILSALFILLYTYKGGIKSLIFNDLVKTFSIILALIFSIYFICKSLNYGAKDLSNLLIDSELSQIFYFDDVKSKLYFWKQFLGGIFIVIAMTGLGQDMMQRVLTCKNIKESQWNLILSSIFQFLVILLFLCLGAILYKFAAVNNIAVRGDKLFPTIASSEGLPIIVGILFIIGLISASYTSAAASLTALTTSFYIDILGVKNLEEKRNLALRKSIHIAITLILILIIYAIHYFKTQSAIDAVFTLASYSYGPILGLFCFGFFTKRCLKAKYIFIPCIIGPLFSYFIQKQAPIYLGGYQFGYEIIILNALLTYLAFFLISFSKKKQ